MKAVSPVTFPSQTFEVPVMSLGPIPLLTEVGTASAPLAAANRRIKLIKDFVILPLIFENDDASILLRGRGCCKSLMTSIVAYSHDIYILSSLPILQIHRLADEMLPETRLI